MSWFKASFLVLSATFFLLLACQNEDAFSDLSQQPESAPHSSEEVNLLDEEQLAKLIDQRDDRILLINV